MRETSVRFSVPGVPVGKGRPRFTRKGHAYTPRKTREREGEIATVALCRRPAGWPLDARYRVEVTIAGSRRVDLDNAAKLALDSLNGILWNDDRQVDRLSVGRIDAGEPRTTVTVEVLP